MSNYTFSILRILSAKGIGNKKAFNLIQKLRTKSIDLIDFINGIDTGNNYSIISEDLIIRIKETRDKVNCYMNELSENKINYINRFESNYPQKLLKVLGDDAPLLLFYKGNSEILKEISIGFCGSREVSDKGLSAIKIIVDFIKDNAVYTSGYAKGVDLKVHEYSLKKGYKTIIVLPEGILNLKIKKQISDCIEWNKVLFISEFLPDSNWSVGNAMQRNSTIVGLSNAMILVEAKEHGGSYNAGLKALELNIPLYTPRYSEDNSQNIGNLLLANRGARAFGINKNTNMPALENLLGNLKSNQNDPHIRVIEQKSLFN
jgi:DNA processing protein